VILSAKRVGPTGVAYGLDMTDEMLALAQQNAREADVTNVHFLKGIIEQIPLPADSVDVVISNCVINLSTDKASVLTEIARVLKPGGRVGVSDVVAEDRLASEERAERGSYIGCIAGALSKSEYIAGLEAAGFKYVSVEFTHEVADGNAWRDRQGGENDCAGGGGVASDPARREGRLLLVPSVDATLEGELLLVVEPADSEASLRLQEAFFADIASRYPGWQPASSQSVQPAELAPPKGVWLVAYLGGRPVGCGGLQRLDGETGEVRRIFLDQAARSRGVGRALLGELEQHARRLGYLRVRLTTGDGQPEALGLFRSEGYGEIDPFTDAAFTRHWMEKAL
jgi:SAM-dependent methyltransferase